MRRTHRSFVSISFVSIVLGAMLVLTLGAPATAVPPTDDPATAAELGAGWLARQVGPEGAVPSATDPAAADLAATADTVLALAAAGVGRHEAESAMDRLEADVDAFVTRDGADVPGSLAVLILAADALGRDPRAFGGADLVARLEATQRTEGADAGLYGAQDPTFDGAYRQALALLALAAAGVDDAEGVAWLVDQQCDDGGWTAYRTDTTAPCPPPDPAAFTGPDTNSTALATHALAAVGATPEHDAVSFLNAARSDDGGWPYIAGGDTDANSTALVIQALLAAGVDVDADAFAALLSFQLGCEAATDDQGSFAFQSVDDGPNHLATRQAVPAAARATYPLGRRTLSDDQPGVVCTQQPVAGPDEPGRPAAGPVTAATLPATGPAGGDAGSAIPATLGAGLVLAGVALTVAGRRREATGRR